MVAGDLAGLHTYMRVKPNALVGIGIWVLYVYFDLFSGLMDQAVFFTVGGILLIGLALGLENLRRTLVGGTHKPTVTS